MKTYIDRSLHRLVVYLNMAFPEHAQSFEELRETFQERHASRLKVARAVALKSYDRLRNPPVAFEP